MLTFERVDNNISIVKYQNVSLTQMAIFIKAHLDNNCSTIKNQSVKRVLSSSNVPVLRASEELLIDFQKRRKTDFTTTLAWEHFQEMMEDTPLGSTERALAINELHRSFGLPDSSYLSMYI